MSVDRIEWREQWSDDIRALIQGAMDRLHVAGAAVAVVSNDNVVMSEGFGYRNIDSRAPADEDTLFAIGSATKAFTTMSAALLAESGDMDWDKPVQSYLPEFQLSDPIATHEATPRDLGSHRVGLPRHEFSWYKADLSRKELIDRLRYLPLSRPFRTTFQYQNMMFTTLGYLVERVSGLSWEQFAARRILAPLGMHRTNFTVKDSKKDENHATPYVTKDGVNRAVPFADIDALGPAGTINSSVKDMAKWVRLHLAGGKLGENRIISETGLAEMHQPQMIIKPPVKDERRLGTAYGLGWFTEVYQGNFILHHGGNIDGFSAMVMLVPSRHLGIVVLCNQEVSVFPASVAYSIVDKALGLPDFEWTPYLADQLQKQFAAIQQAGNYDAERKEGTVPSHNLEDYCGDFEHQAYGTARISMHDGQLFLTYHTWPEEVPMEHYHYDVFIMRAEMETIPMTWRVPFRAGLNGAIDELEIQFEDLTAPIVFKRKAVSVDLSATELERYAGDYTLLDVQTLTVDLVGDSVLALIVAGQPPYTLLPEADHRFALKGLSGFAVQFHVSDTGECTGGDMIQPNGIFAFKRA